MNGYGASYVVSGAIQALALPFIFLARREKAVSDPIRPGDEERLWPRPPRPPSRRPARRMLGGEGHRSRGPMPRLQYKPFASPDHERTFPHGSAQVVTLDDATIGLARWEPGWRWSTDLAPIAGTASCQVHHLGYAISGPAARRHGRWPGLEIRPGSAYEIPSGHDASVVGDEAFVTLEWTSAHVVGVDIEAATERILATVLFTDIVGSTATLERMGDARWRDVLSEHNRRLRDLLNRYRGREIDTTGDGFLALFDSASRAVRCGLAMTAAAPTWGSRSGSASTRARSSSSATTRAASRSMPPRASSRSPATDEVVVSETTRDLLEGSGLVVEDAGMHELKGITGRAAPVPGDGARRPRCRRRAPLGRVARRPFGVGQQQRRASAGSWSAFMVREHAGRSPRSIWPSASTRSGSVRHRALERPSPL